MRFIPIFLFLILINITHAFEIHSVTPEEIYPNTTITIRGNFDTENLIILLGKEELKFNQIDKEHITLTMPQNIDPAIYFINFFNKLNKNILASIPIKISKPKPSIFEYEPKFLEYCSENKNIQIRGENLNFIKHIFINGQEIENYEKSNSFIIINLYDSLHLNTKPEIEDAFISNNFFNYYEITIRGKNFVNGSKLFVNNIEINEKSSNAYDGIYFFGQQYINKRQSTTLLHDTFYISSCDTIILTRYPFTRDDKILKILIESPTGKKSSEFVISAP